jgi:hypothetical protein
MTTTPTTISQLPAQSGALTGGERLVMDLDGATVAASAITAGGAYRVLTVGTTDWTTIGAASSAIDVAFVATATGTGTGTAVALLTRRVSAQQVADLASTGPVDLAWNPTTRTISSSAGADAQLTLASSSADGLMPSGDAAKIAAIVTTGTPGQALRLGSDGIYRGHTFTAGDVGADSVGAAAAAIAAHLAAPDPHPGLAQVSWTGAYGDLSGLPTLGTAAALNHGAVAGNLVRLDPTTGRLPPVDGSQLTNLPTGPGGGVSDGDKGDIVVSGGGTTWLIDVTVRANWDTAYTERLSWDGSSTGLNPGTGRTSLGLGTAAQSQVGDFATAAQGAMAASAIQPGNPALSDAREWLAPMVSRADAEAGTATDRRAWSVQRVWQAIAAWWAAASSPLGRSLAGATDAEAARTLLGLGSLATQSGTFAALSSTAPSPLGTAAVGTGSTAARADHVHELPTLAALGAAASGPIGSSGLVMAAGVLGRETGSGAPQVYSLGSGLAIVAGALTVTASGSGTVTNVGLSLPSIFSVTNSPVTTTGTLTATLANQSPGLVFAGPASGSPAEPGFRQLGYSELTGLPTLFDPASPGAIGGTTPGSGAFTSLTASARIGLPSGAHASPAARDLYALGSSVAFRSSSNVEVLLLNAADNLSNLSSPATARTNLGAQKAITVGTAAPSGGQDGDIYIQIT